mmetsp:Transcript_128376/g.357354  ORF Transcript_128376/g.357354 Transcript_128376/m.357354 type:complete len:233 (-) Transcript_128376:265-963(-)
MEYSASTSDSRVDAMLLVSASISVVRRSMAPLFVSIFCSRSRVVSLQFSSVIAHSSSAADFFLLNSSSSWLRMSRSGCEWNLYSGSIGSTVDCKKAEAAPHLGPLEMIFMASATSRLLCTVCFMARVETGVTNLDSSTFCFASSRDWMAFVRSALLAMYMSCSCWQVSLVVFNVPFSSTCSFSLSSLSACLFFFTAVSSSMLAESVSILPLVVRMLLEMSLVFSLQKHEKAV